MTYIYIYIYKIIYIYISEHNFLHMYQICGTRSYHYRCVSAKELTETNECYLIIAVEFRQLCKVIHIRKKSKCNIFDLM